MNDDIVDKTFYVPKSPALAINYIFPPFSFQEKKVDQLTYKVYGLIDVVLPVEFLDDFLPFSFRFIVSAYV